MTLHKHYNIAFWITLFISAGLIIGGFFTPPLGVVDGSVLSSVGLLFLWPALAFAAKALSEGNKAKIKHLDTEIEIGNEAEVED